MGEGGTDAVSLATTNLEALERRGAKSHQRAALVSPAGSHAVSKTRVSGQTLISIHIVHWIAHS